MSNSPSSNQRSPSPYLGQQDPNNITIQTDDVRGRGLDYGLNRPSGEKGSYRKKRRRTMTTNKTLNEQPSKKSSYQLPKSLRVSGNLQEHSPVTQSRYYREKKFFKESASQMHQIHSRFIPKLLDEKNIVLTKQLIEKRVDNAYEMFVKRQHKLSQYYNQNIEQYHTAIDT